MLFILKDLLFYIYIYIYIYFVLVASCSFYSVFSCERIEKISDFWIVGERIRTEFVFLLWRCVTACETCDVTSIAEKKYRIRKFLLTLDNCCLLKK
jgi:hypothetical protein